MTRASWGERFVAFRQSIWGLLLMTRRQTLRSGGGCVNHKMNCDDFGGEQIYSNMTRL
jgi:hypothetical protein